MRVRVAVSRPHRNEISFLFQDNSILEVEIERSGLKKTAKVETSCSRSGKREKVMGRWSPWSSKLVIDRAVWTSVRPRIEFWRATDSVAGTIPSCFECTSTRESHRRRSIHRMGDICSNMSVYCRYMQRKVSAMYAGSSCNR